MIRRTVLAENAGLGVEVGETDTLVDARKNYWGASEGPNSDGPSTDPVTGEVADGEGDAVSGSVTESRAAVRFDPFLTETPDSDSDSDADSGPLARFDTDRDGRIESGEVLDAIVSFNADVDVGGRPVSARDVLDVVVAYNFDQPV